MANEKVATPDVKTMSLDNIMEYCFANGKMDWLEAEMAKTSTSTKDGKVTIRPITLITLRADFKREILGIKPKYNKKPTMQDRFAAFKTAKGIK